MARDNLKHARRDAGMTQQQVADAVGVTLRYYQSLEAGSYMGGIPVWDALEDLFGINQRRLRELCPEGGRP